MDRTPDPSGGSSGGDSSAPLGGSSSYTEAINVGCSRVVVIKTQAVFDVRSEGYGLPAKVVEAIDNFVVRNGSQRAGSRKSCFMYSLGVYVKPIYVNSVRLVHAYPISL